MDPFNPFATWTELPKHVLARLAQSKVGWGPQRALVGRELA
jgi:hypothetical protein